MVYIYGIVDIKAQDIFDIDEAGMKLVSANRRHGKAHKCLVLIVRLVR